MDLHVRAPAKLGQDSCHFIKKRPRGDPGGCGPLRMSTTWGRSRIWYRENKQMCASGDDPIPREPFSKLFSRIAFAQISLFLALIFIVRRDFCFLPSSKILLESKVEHPQVEIFESKKWKFPPKFGKFPMEPSCVSDHVTHAKTIEKSKNENNFLQKY